MKMTEAQYDKLGDTNMGYCTNCEAITTSDVYPDESKKVCIRCEKNTCMGVEEAKIYGHIDIDEDSDEVAVISFGDDDEDMDDEE